jgi:hypothetical protein
LTHLHLTNKVSHDEPDGRIHGGARHFGKRARAQQRMMFRVEIGRFLIIAFFLVLRAMLASVVFAFVFVAWGVFIV